MKKSLESKRKLLSLWLLLAVIAIPGCTKRVAFMNSTVVPAASGYVSVKTDKNKNNAIAVHLSRLAEVERLQPAKQTYVVWMLTEDNITKNIGQIKSSSGVLSGRLKATFETVSAFKPAKIFITAEDDADTQYPGSQLILETRKIYK